MDINKLNNKYNKLAKMETSSSFDITGSDETHTIDGTSIVGMKIRDYLGKLKSGVLADLKDTVEQL